MKILNQQSFFAWCAGTVQKFKGLSRLMLFLRLLYHHRSVLYQFLLVNPQTPVEEDPNSMDALDSSHRSDEHPLIVIPSGYGKPAQIRVSTDSSRRIVSWQLVQSSITYNFFIDNKLLKMNYYVAWLFWLNQFLFFFRVKLRTTPICKSIQKENHCQHLIYHRNNHKQLCLKLVTSFSLQYLHFREFYCLSLRQNAGAYIILGLFCKLFIYISFTLFIKKNHIYNILRFNIFIKFYAHFKKRIVRLLLKHTFV